MSVASASAKRPISSRASPSQVQAVEKSSSLGRKATSSSHASGAGPGAISSSSVSAALLAELVPAGSTLTEQLAALRAKLAQTEADNQAASEALQWTIRQNKNTLLALKQENKDLKAEVSKRGGNAALSGGSITSSPGGSGGASSNGFVGSGAVGGAGGPRGEAARAMERAERQVHELRRTYDKLVKDKKSLAQKLDNLQDSMRDAAKSAGALAALSEITETTMSVTSSVASSVSGTGFGGGTMVLGPVSRELRTLQNRLAKAGVKCNEAAAIRGTYEEVLARLKREGPRVEAAIRTAQAALAARDGELEAARRAVREASVARDVAKARLAEAEASLAKARARREHERGEMREKASMLHSTNQALLAHQFKPLSGSGGGSNGVSPAGTATTHTSNSTAQGQGKTGVDDSKPTSIANIDNDGACDPGTQPSSSSPVSVVSAASVIRRLMSATAVASCEALLRKLLPQQQSYAQLQDMRGAAAAQRLALETQLAALRAHAEDLRSGGKLSTQRQLDSAQTDLREAQAALEAARTSHEALLRLWVDVRGGLEHLAGMVPGLPLPAGALPVPMSDETLQDVLAQCEQRLVGAHRFIQTIPKAAAMLQGLAASPDINFNAT